MLKLHIKRKSLLEEEKKQLLQKLKEKFDQYKDYYWVFFDTETTGKEPATEQITEFAAIAVDADFSNYDESAIQDSLHKKVYLRQDMEISDTTDPNDPRAMSRAQVASMTRAGAPKDPKKAMRKGVKPFSAEDFVEEAELCSLIDSFFKKLETNKKIVLVAHNARFDVGFVRETFKRNGLGDFNYPTIDTVRLAQDFYVPLLRLGKEQELVATYDKLFSQTEIETINKGSLSKKLGVLAKTLDIDAKGWHSAIADVKMLIDVTKAMFKQLETYGSSYEVEEKPKFTGRKYGSQKV
jgi:DNA polymerase III alpha subunit (gram-positive type)